MVNEDYEPSENEERILDILKDGRDAGEPWERNEPWGHTTPADIREQTGIEKGNVEYHLRQLTAAGWIEKGARGFYRFKEDPREDPPAIEQLAEQARERWGDDFRIEATYWTDGDVDYYAYHNSGRDEDGLRVRDRMAIYENGVGIVRQYLEPDCVVREETLREPHAEGG